MSVFEYRVVPAPRRGKSGKGLRGMPAKFANAMTGLMNDMGAEGWEYLRADTLPCEERQGLTGKTVKYHSLLVFRRPADEVSAQEQEAAETLALPLPVEDEVEEAPMALEQEMQVETAETDDTPQASEAQDPYAEGAELPDQQPSRPTVAAE